MSKEILEMIESVDPNDTDTLDEIDARVFEYLINGKTPKAFFYWDGAQPKGSNSTVADWIRRRKPHKQYTRSRDALPDWPRNLDIQEQVTIFPNKSLCDAGINNGSVVLTPWKPVWCKTECLARLHTRLQAIEWERSQ